MEIEMVLFTSGMSVQYVRGLFCDVQSIVIESYARCRVFVTIEFWNKIGLGSHNSSETRFFLVYWDDQPILYNLSGKCHIPIFYLCS